MQILPERRIFRPKVPTSSTASTSTTIPDGSTYYRAVGDRIGQIFEERATTQLRMVYEEDSGSTVPNPRQDATTDRQSDKDRRVHGDQDDVQTEEYDCVLGQAGLQTTPLPRLLSDHNRRRHEGRVREEHDHRHLQHSAEEEQDPSPRTLHHLPDTVPHYEDKNGDEKRRTDRTRNRQGLRLLRRERTKVVQQSQHPQPHWSSQVYLNYVKDNVKNNATTARMRTTRKRRMKSMTQRLENVRASDNQQEQREHQRAT
eukprot:6491806-Amphidinium_carterae.1